MRTLLVALLGLFASTSHALDLLGSYERALRHDPSILAAGEALAAGREKAVQGDALLLPQVSLIAGYSRIEDKSGAGLPPPFPAAESSGRTQHAALQLKQPVYDAKAAADKEQLNQRAGLAEVSFHGSRQDLMQRVSEAYFRVLLAEESLRVTQAEKAAVGQQRDRAQARFEVGRGRITELQEAQARYDGVLAREISARSTLALRRSQYHELTGAHAEGLAPLRPGFVPALPQPDSLAAWQRKSAAGNTRVQSRERELAIAVAETGKHKLASRPTLDLVASYSRRGQDGGLSPLSAPDDLRSAQVGLQLTIPLFAGGALDSRERESLARRREAEHELGAAQRDARLQVEDAFLAVHTGVARIAALEQSVRSAHTALEATTLGRDIGNRTELDVLDAQQRLYAAQLDLAQARNDYLLSRIRLAYAAGDLTESDLQTLNSYLER